MPLAQQREQLRNGHVGVVENLAWISVLLVLLTHAGLGEEICAVRGEIRRLCEQRVGALRSQARISLLLSSNGMEKFVEEKFYWHEDRGAVVLELLDALLDVVQSTR